MIAFAVAGVWLGYGSAAQIRAQKLEESRVSTASEHFMAGLVAQQNKQYEIARIQFEHVIQLDPSFPGAQDKLREVMIEMAMDKTPTPAATVVTPTLTPTLDIRPQEEIYNQARQLYAAKDWNNLFAAIDSLRRVDTKYKAVEIDGMLYVAYRFRGIDKIIHTANLEGGLYDLALAERFAPLDVDSLGYQNWARMYLNGASFWQIDWLKVMQYFEQIYPYFPNMRDASGITAIERYRIAAKSQGDKLNASGDYCAAYDYYQKSLQAVPDQAVENKAAEVYLLCHPPTKIPTIAPTTAPTVDQPTTAPTQPQPTAPQPTQEPTAEPTVAPPVIPTTEPTSGTP
ncbi:MAG: hypothetical protein IH586_06485 [Anaerolineaceae bacterium]|nr:hypothetical protein [Anaerolineaceae bacterium]